MMKILKKLKDGIYLAGLWPFIMHSAFILILAIAIKSIFIAIIGLMFFIEGVVRWHEDKNEIGKHK